MPPSSRPQGVGTGVDFTMSGEGIPLHGTTWSNDHALIGNIELSAVAESATYPFSTDAHGSFEVRLPAGEYRIVTRSERYAAYPRAVVLPRDHAVDIEVLRVPAAPRDGTGELRAWVKQRCRPLASEHLEPNASDVDAFVPALARASIVGLGEQTHGTREFVATKHLVSRLLIERFGFRLVGMELRVLGGLKFDDYVQGQGTDDVRAILVKYAPLLWQTVETAEFLEWLRRHNAPLPARERAHVFGMAPDGAAELLAALGAVGLPEATCVSDLTKHAATWDRTQQLQAIRAARVCLDRNQERVATRELRHARRLAIALEQAIEASDVPNSSLLQSLEANDRMMAANMLWAIESEWPGSRAVAWAHNGHLAKQYLGDTGVPSMGSRWRDALGERYFAVAQLFDQGTFQAFDGRGAALSSVLTPFEVPPARDGSLEWLLRSAHHEVAFLNLREASGAAKKALDDFWPVRAASAAFFGDEYTEVQPLRDFDALVYFAHGRAERSLTR